MLVSLVQGMVNTTLQTALNREEFQQHFIFFFFMLLLLAPLNEKLFPSRFDNATVIFELQRY